MTPIHREEFSMNIRDYVEELLSQFRAQDAVHVWETTGFDHRGREKCWLNLTGALSESVIEPFKQACLSIGADFEPDVFDSARYLFELRCPYDVPIIRWQVPSGPHGRGWTCKPDLGQIVSLILLAAGHSDVEIPANFEDFCEDDPPSGGGNVLEAQGDVAARIESKPPLLVIEGTRDEARRRQQQEENARIQDEVISLSPPTMTVDDMLADCVWIASGSQVGRLSAPKSVLTSKEFCDLTACNFTEVGDPDSMAKPRKVLNATLWKKDAARKTVQTRTFHAGAGEICRDPDGETALNSWRPIGRHAATADVQPFLDHVAYLFPDAAEREAFLDWLAHIEQHPGVLPHFGWLHIAANTGTGRNWLASVLARVWRGYVAPNVDLPTLLESQFNGPLAGRVLAMVDEVQEGGGENPFRHANRLKSLVNVEERVINPKFGRQYREYNACRWLVFSNHTNALPLSDTDRRWRVVLHQAAPRSPEMYTELYKLLGDAEFVNSVGMFLRQRDISRFNPGERPPMTEAKCIALNASKSMIQQTAEQLVARWPADVITNADAADVLGDGQDKGFTPAMRRALTEAGAIQYGDGRVVKVNGKSAKCWILRNGERWIGVVPVDIATEVARARGFDSLRSAIDVLAESSRDEDTPNF